MTRKNVSGLVFPSFVITVFQTVVHGLFLVLKGLRTGGGGGSRQRCGVLSPVETCRRWQNSLFRVKQGQDR